MTPRATAFHHTSTVTLTLKTFTSITDDVFSTVWHTGNLQFYGLVPHDDVSRQNEGLDVDDVCVTTLCPHVQPFTLKGEVTKCDPRK